MAVEGLALHGGGRACPSLRALQQCASCPCGIRRDCTAVPPAKALFAQPRYIRIILKKVELEIVDLELVEII